MFISVFRDAGVDLTLASPEGVRPPIDPKSDLPENQTPAMARFKQDPRAQKELSKTVKLSTVRAEDFDSVFYPGGHGPMWELAEDPHSIRLLESFYNSGKPVTLACYTKATKRRGAPERVGHPTSVTTAAFWHLHRGRPHWKSPVS